MVSVYSKAKTKAGLLEVELGVMRLSRAYYNLCKPVKLDSTRNAIKIVNS